MLAQHIKAYKTTATVGTALPLPAKTSVKMANNADTDQTLLRDGLMCHRGGKNHDLIVTWIQGLSLIVRALYQLRYQATWVVLWHIPPALLRFVPEFARNNWGTTRNALFDAQGPSPEPPHWPPNVTGEEKIVAGLGLEPRTSRLLCKHSAELPSHLVILWRVYLQSMPRHFHPKIKGSLW